MVSGLVVLGVVFVGSFFCFGWGLVVANRGLELRRERRALESAESDPVGRLRPGPAEVVGTAEPVGKETAEPAGETGTVESAEGRTIDAPFSDGEALVAEWEVREFRDGPLGGAWTVEAEGVGSVPFHVDDGTGRVLVDPSSAELHLDEYDEPVREVRAGDDPPVAIRRFERSEGIDATPDADRSLLDGGHATGDRRYDANLLEPGEEVYVYGMVVPADAGEERVREVAAATAGDGTGGAGATAADAAGTFPRGSTDRVDLRIVPPPEDVDGVEDLFVVSDRDRSDLVGDRSWVLWRVPVGGVLALAGLAGMLAVVRSVLLFLWAVVELLVGLVPRLLPGLASLPGVVPLG